jgi:16S rRNA (guanine527-N7)-methyltransferase
MEERLRAGLTTVGETLHAGLAALGLDASTERMEPLLSYISEIKKWNPRHNLVKAGDEELVVRHVLDSLAPLDLIKNLGNMRTILDVGAGAGLPGIPLAVFMPDRRFTLCERSATRCAFLRNVCLLLGLKNVSVLEADLSRITDSFDLVLFRAVSKVRELLPHLVRVVAAEGFILAYKGTLEKTVAETRELQPYFRHLRVYGLRVPFMDAQRHILIARRADMAGRL